MLLLVVSGWVSQAWGAEPKQDTLNVLAVFPEAMSDAVFERRAEALRRQHPKAVREAGPNWPVDGCLVSTIVPGSQAERIGIRPDDFMLAFGDTRIYGAVDFNNERRKVTQVLWVQTPGQPKRPVKIEPGLVGVTYHGTTVRHRWYLDHGQRDARWDELMVLAALTAYSEDADFAAEAIRRAVARGYAPDEFTDALISWVLLARGRWAELSVYEDRIRSGNAEMPCGVGAKSFYFAARAAGRCDRMVELFTEELWGQEGELADEHRAWLAALPEKTWPGGPTPQQVAEAWRKPKQINGDLVPAPHRYYNDETLHMLPPIQWGHGFNVNLEPDMFVSSQLKAPQGIGDFHLHLRLRMVNPGEPEPGSENAFYVRLTDIDRELISAEKQNSWYYWHGPSHLAGFVVSHGIDPVDRTKPDLRLQHFGISGNQQLPSPFLPDRMSQRNEYDFYRVDGWVQVVINGQTLMLMPDHGAGRNLMLHVYFKGMVSVVDTLHLLVP